MYGLEGQVHVQGLALGVHILEDLYGTICYYFL